MVMDMLDGRVARLMKATSQFGVEFDSLADVVSFGVAPAFILYSFALAELPRAAWFGAALFVICGALRLARFNVQTGTVDKRFFVGLPIPAAAGVAVSTVIVLQGVELTRWMQIAIAVGTYVVALLMVSTFRYWSFKEIDFARRRPLQTLLVVVLGVMIVATNHEIFPFLLFVGYAVSGPVYRLWSGRAPSPAAATLESAAGVPLIDGGVVDRVMMIRTSGERRHPEGSAEADGDISDRGPARRRRRAGGHPRGRAGPAGGGQGDGRPFRVRAGPLWGRGHRRHRAIRCLRRR